MSLTQTGFPGKLDLMAEETIDLNELSKRPARYWGEDGLAVLMFGLSLIVVNGILLVRQTLPPELTYDLLEAALGIGFCFAVAWARKKLKARIAIPRGGYVALRPQTIARIIGFLLVLAVGVVRFPRGSIERNLFLLPGFAFLMSLLSFIVVIQSRKLHFLWPAVVSLLSAVWIYRNEIGFGRVPLFLMLIGASVTVSGALQLRAFLKSHPMNQGPEA